MYSPSFLTIFLAFARTFLYLLVPHEMPSYHYVNTTNNWLIIHRPTPNIAHHSEVLNYLVHYSFAMDTLPRVRGLLFLSHDIDRFSLLASIWWLSLWMDQRVCWHLIVLIWWYPSNDHLWSLQDEIPLSGSTLSFMLQTTRMLLLHSFHH